MATIDKIKKLTSQLFPTGRAFRIIPDGVKEKLYNGLAVSEAQAYDDALSILNSALPDNDNFTTDDATDWERRLGLITNSSLTLAVRKQAILRKMNYGLDIRPRGHYLFLQRELQAAGFDVYVFENIFDDGMGGLTTKTYDDIILSFYGEFQHGEYQHGEFDHGDDVDGGLVSLVVNSLDEDIDNQFNVGSNLKSTFFIGGAYLGEFADVDVERKKEFRQLILRIKPVQTVGYLLVNFV